MLPVRRPIGLLLFGLLDELADASALGVDQFNQAASHESGDGFAGIDGCGEQASVGVVTGYRLDELLPRVVHVGGNDVEGVSARGLGSCRRRHRQRRAHRRAPCATRP